MLIIELQCTNKCLLCQFDRRFVNVNSCSKQTETLLFFEHSFMVWKMYIFIKN